MRGPLPTGLSVHVAVIGARILSFRPLCRRPRDHHMTILASGIILYRREGRDARLLLLRNRGTGQWGFPKGRRDAGDRHEVHTALREVLEETGYERVQLHPDFRIELAYVVRDPAAPYPKRVTYFLAEAP